MTVALSASEFHPWKITDAEADGTYFRSRKWRIRQS